MNTVNLVIVGATGAVGKEILNILKERNFPINKLRLCATSRSAGTEIEFQGHKYLVEETTPDSFNGMDVALIAGGNASLEFGNTAVERGCVVNAHSRNYLMDPQVASGVPDV